MNIINQSKMQELYIDYWNNFLTISRFAEYYSISESLARIVIRKGKAALYNSKALDDKRFSLERECIAGERVWVLKFNDKTIYTTKKFIVAVDYADNYFKDL